jgi:hypothetical protein
MKYTLTILFAFISVFTLAQGNLQFNKVINYVIPSTTVSPPSGQGVPVINGTLTIPSNKVWKIESSGYKSGTNTTWSLFLDNYTLFSYSKTGGGGLNYYYQSPFPIWLPSGTYNWKAEYYDYISFTSATFNGASISIIEYNIVP